MRETRWVRGCPWTKLIVRRPHISSARIDAIRLWCRTFDGDQGAFMIWVVDYTGYAVVRIERPEQALAFKMRWL